MSNGFDLLSSAQLNRCIAEHLSPQIESIINQRGVGHCMRITDLEDAVILAVCQQLNKTLPDRCFILTDQTEVTQPFHITSTKLVELRNPDAQGELRPPLLVFIPTILHTSAEDSFSVATFEALQFPHLYQDITRTLLARLPKSLVGTIDDLFQRLSEESWPFFNVVAGVRYLLTALNNGVDGETLGASLYELALIPDFKWFAEPSRITGKLQRNLDCVRVLMSSYRSTRGRVIELGLSNNTLQTQLFHFFEQYNIQNPVLWTRFIAIEKQWWSLSFDKWLFQTSLTLDNLSLTVLETDLPVIQEDETDAQLIELIGQQVLIPKQRKNMSVIFQVAPIPNQVQGLDHFTLQIIAENAGVMGKSKQVNAWKTKNAKKTVKLLKLNQIDFEEGWYFIRVLAWTKAGDPIPMEGDSTTESKPSFESDVFYVLPDGKLEEEPPQRAIPKAQSVEHALLRMQLIACGEEDRQPEDIHLSSVAWCAKQVTKKTSRQATLLATFGGKGKVQIEVSPQLKTCEQRILAKPKQPSGWRLQINRDIAEQPSEVALQLPKSNTLHSFLAARETLFNLVRQGDAELIMQGFHFAQAETECLTYAESFLALLQHLKQLISSASGIEKQHHLRSLRDVMALDSVHVVVTDFRGHPRELVLVSPTHPLRVLWLLSWTTLGQDWIKQLKTGYKEHIAAVNTALLEDLYPLAYPIGIPVEDGRIFTCVDHLSLYWGLYAPMTEENPHALKTDIATALGLKESGGIVSGVSGQVIADKMGRYLSQHPYVRELTINLFNPGSATMIAEALMAMQQKPETMDLRYNLRLFAADPNDPLLGEAIDNLSKPETTVNEAAHAFTMATGNHLFSKLQVAKHRLTAFHHDVQAFPAHLSLLLDIFPAEKLSVLEKTPEVATLHGLVQDFRTDFVDDEAGTFWHQYPVLGVPIATSIESPCFELLAKLSQHICYCTSAVATSEANFKSVPVTTLGLNAQQRELIYEVHQVSDWVFTIDRNIGIEFFDHGGRKDRPDYLIDYVPASHPQVSHHLILSSRSHDELEAMLKPVMDQFGLAIDNKQAISVLSALRSLSGQLALKLISAPTQQAEALGLALARLYLEYQGALKNQMIVPLDAHTDLYHSKGEEANSGISLQRTDLALFDLNLAERTITCHLVEVKCYSQVGEVAAFNQLKEKISAQINQSERLLQRHFDSAYKTPDRPDRLLKSREFAQLLRFYLERAVRYGIFEVEAEQEAHAFLQTIEKGYSLQFKRCALIFDFEVNGTELPENEVGIEFHRLGKDVINALLAGTNKPDTTDSLSELLIEAVPKLERAAFIAEKRERTTTYFFAEDWADEAADSFIPDNNKASYEDSKTTEELTPKTQGINEQSAIHSPVEAAKAVAATMDAPPEKETLDYDILLGVNGDSPQYGMMGEVAGRKIALDLNHTHTISLFGVQGGGKSYTLGSVIEMAVMPIKQVNVLPSPLATVIFHYSPTQDYAPEFTSMIHPNTIDEEIQQLQARYGANPQALNDVLILTSADKVAERQAEYPNIKVCPIAFSANELKAPHWKFLMGAIGNQSMYLKQINLIMRGLRNHLTLEAIRQGIEASSLANNLKDIAQTRLQFASEYIADGGQQLKSLIRPGRLIIVDLRDDYIEKDEALGLFVVMLQIFSEATYNGQPFNKLVVFDEAHKYIENDDLVAGLVEVVREMRHKGTSIMVASQDPPSVPIALIELSSQIIMHKFNSPAWLKHIQKANAALADLTSQKMSHLGAGEAFVWSSKASDDSFSQGAVKIQCRPRVTQHGGSTKTAVGDLLKEN